VHPMDIGPAAPPTQIQDPIRIGAAALMHVSF